VAIIPENKDWTWVLQRPCPECGLDVTAATPADVADALEASLPRWRAFLAHPDVAVRTRDDRWSPLEYACHVRDVFRICAGRLALMRAEDDPQFPNWDQDRSAVEDRYQEQDPATVADELDAAAAAMLAEIRGVRPDELARTGQRSDGARFTVESFLRYFLHDPMHHLWDVEQDLG